MYDRHRDTLIGRESGREAGEMGRETGREADTVTGGIGLNWWQEWEYNNHYNE